jgi:alkyl hydroperoxide reductase subunit AhpC
MAWQKHDIGPMHLPMCSDFYPHGAVTQAFGVFREGTMLPGISNRAVFIVDKSGKIAFAEVYPLDQTPNNETILEALRKINDSQRDVA